MFHIRFISRKKVVKRVLILLLAVFLLGALIGGTIGYTTAYLLVTRKGVMICRNILTG